MLLTLATMVLSWATATRAVAASPIEGIWSFNGGEIAVQALSNGTFAGSVVQETKFAECSHPAGQQIWSDIKPQPDDSYWGLHQWYESPGCSIEPTLGPTVWRVASALDGSRYLRVCFSIPGTTQPKIAPDNSEQEVTYGCTNSARIAPLPPTSGTLSFAALTSLPPKRRCLSRRKFQIHIHDPKHDAFKTIVLTLNGRRLNAVRHGPSNVATINLKGLSAGTFTVKIRAISVLGRHLSGRRVYSTCKRKRVAAKGQRGSRL